TAGGDEFVEWPAAANGHEGGASLLGRAVEAHGEVVGLVFLGEPEDAGDDADGADGDASGAEIEAAGGGDDGECGEDGVVIVKRFTHAHEDEIAQARLATGAEVALGVEYLRDDLAGAEVARETHLPGG